MPLPPAPTHRASRLTHKAFESSEEQTDASVMVQIETKRSLTSETSDTPMAKRPVRSRKNETGSLTPLNTGAAQAIAANVLMSKQPSEPHTASAGAARGVGKATTARAKKRNGPSKLFVLDTNVLMHDPMSLFRFEEHDVFLPMIVLEELDGHKKGMTEVARNARQASRSLDTLASAQGADLGKGSPLSTTGHTDAMGQLFFQTQALDLSLPLALPQGKADNQILGVVKALGQLHAPRDVVLVSKDINMRVKARALGLQAEDYQNDKTLEDGDLLYPGSMALPQDFWTKNGKTVESWQQ